MMSERHRVAMVTVGVLLLLSGTAWSLSSITGRIVHLDGSGIPGFKVVLLNDLGSIQQTKITDADGKYEIDSVGFGDYELQFVAPPSRGFFGFRRCVFVGSSGTVDLGDQEFPTQCLEFTFQNVQNVGVGPIEVQAVGPGGIHRWETCRSSLQAGVARTTVPVPGPYVITMSRGDVSRAYGTVVVERGQLCNPILVDWPPSSTCIVTSTESTCVEHPSLGGVGSRNEAGHGRP